MFRARSGDDRYDWKQKRRRLEAVGSNVRDGWDKMGMGTGRRISRYRNTK